MDQPIRPSTEAPRSEVAADADFSIIRYAQCWEDADVLLEALAIRPGDRCFSIASGGDNTLSMLACDPAHVVAIDLSPAQVALVELKAASFVTLSHTQMLEFLGIVPTTWREELYRRVRSHLSESSRAFWDARPAIIESGVSNAGKFEHYFEIFRRYLLPLVHSQAEVDALFESRKPEARREFFAKRWNTLRWHALFRLFCSRPVMGALGRDPRFFRYVEGSVADRILARTRHALIDLDPSSNPYLHWVVYGRFGKHLPHALREENFEAIRRNVPKLELRVASVEAFLAQVPAASLDCFNLSDIFEYVSEQASDAIFDDVARACRPGARIAYWNMMAPRRRPERLAARLQPLGEKSAHLHANAQTFFYGAFEVDQAAS